MMLQVRTVTSSGRFAMCTIVSATCSGSKVASRERRPSGWSVPSGGGDIPVCAPPEGVDVLAQYNVESEPTIGYSPMSICVQAMLNALPSRAVDFVKPVMACLDKVYGAEWGRGT